MAVFASTAKVSGRPLTEIIGSDELTTEQWESIQAHVRQGGKKIIQLRGRSSFQSPSHHALLMVKAVIEDGGYDWPCGTYVNAPEAGFEKVMMAMETTLGAGGVTYRVPAGAEEELAALRASYDHVAKLRDEVIDMGLLPPLAEWISVNPNLA
jgi:malate dehydrogenase